MDGTKNINLSIGIIIHFCEGIMFNILINWNKSNSIKDLFTLKTSQSVHTPATATAEAWRVGDYGPEWWGAAWI